jgi:serine/threonine-protein kinase RsbW
VNSQYVQFDVVISSDYESGQAIVERIMNAVDNCGFSTRDTFGIRLSVDEAVINAIKHGNQFNPDKTVRIDFHSSEQGVRIEIEDQGVGFDSDRVQSEGEPGHPGKTSPVITSPVMTLKK